VSNSCLWSSNCFENEIDTANAIANDKSYNIIYSEDVSLAHKLVAKATSLLHKPFESGGGQLFRKMVQEAVRDIM
jgi:hypothetical protein